MTITGACQLYPPVPYSELARIYESSDIVLFVESLEERYKYIARLSFSTKLTDYLACGRCILAVGAEDIAPMEYLRNAGIAVLCYTQKQVVDNLKSLLSHKEEIILRAKDSVDFGKKNHSAEIMHDRLINSLIQLTTHE